MESEVGRGRKKVVVVGGGAAGIIAAWRAATLGADVTLIEKTSRLGTKILISGGGKCNICHDGDLRDVLKAFRKNEAEFIRPACYRFPNHQIIELLTAKGLEVYTRPDGRIFPTNGTAKDVVAILADYLKVAGVTVKLSTSIDEIIAVDGQIQAVKYREKTEACDALILATGGSSYPNSGTTGDGWPWAKQLGHSVVRVRAALAPIYLVGNSGDPATHESQLDYTANSGIALRDCLLKARLNGKEIARWKGDLLFTHHGVSGPTVLGVSREVAEKISEGKITLEADLLPTETFETTGEKLGYWIEDNPRKLTSSLVEAWLAERLVPGFMQSADVPEKPVRTLSQKEKNRLIATVKGWNLGTVRSVPLEKGEVVAGGISLDEVDPKTMASLKCEGLYLCGEILDIAGPVGGYNLQAAFATGYVAGESAAIVKQG